MNMYFILFCICIGKIFHGIVKTRRLFGIGGPDILQPQLSLGLILIEKDGPVVQTVQNILVEEKHAELMKS